jgi:hypothetical protein
MIRLLFQVFRSSGIAAKPLPVVLLTLLGFASDAGAQQTGFVQADFGADIRRFSGEDADRVFDARATSVTMGAAGFLTSHVSVSIELDIGASVTESRSVSLTVSGRPSTITTSYTLRRRTVAALAGLHTSDTRRVRLGCYAGLGFSSVRREISSDAPPIVLSAPQPPTVFLDRTAEPIVGADVAVRIVRHLSVLASLRAASLTLSPEQRGFSIRPGAGLRLLF